MSKDDLPKRLRAEAWGMREINLPPETTAILREAAREIERLRRLPQSCASCDGTKVIPSGDPEFVMAPCPACGPSGRPITP